MFIGTSFRGANIEHLSIAAKKFMIFFRFIRHNTPSVQSPNPIMPAKTLSIARCLMVHPLLIHEQAIAYTCKSDCLYM